MNNVTTQDTIEAICALAQDCYHAEFIEASAAREAVWLRLRGCDVTVVKLPGECRWRILTASTDTKLTTFPVPVLAARSILHIADEIACDPNQS